MPTATRDGVRKDFLAVAAAQLKAAPAGSDQQLAWARTLADVSRHGDTELSLLRSVLDGSVVIDGLAVDAELRWSLWQALAAHGQASQAELDRELEADKTASGREGHALASAARPDPSMKAAAWDSAVLGTGLSNEILSATIAGFATAPAALLEPYVEPYFDCLEKVWAERSIEIAGRIVRGLFPAAQDLGDGMEPARHPVVLRTDEWLAEHGDAPRALRRIIIEQRSHLLRALTAQAANG